jgi:two-component system CheB/CheR fusion protein
MSVTHPAGFPIIGIGASAGGVEALTGFFRGMPNPHGMAFVVVTHLSRERESRLHEVLANLTSMPVQVATDGLAVQPGTVYVLPADAVLGIERGRLLLQRPNSAQRGRHPIDIFFAALAVDQGESAAGVVLSGGDGDGTLGLKAIKEYGGLTMAQVRDGHGPQHPDMPDSAISAGVVDLALPAGEMGPRLVEFARGLSMLDGVASGGAADEEMRRLEESQREIYAMLRTRVGHDFAGYKPKTFLRRVHRRMQISQRDTVQAYVEQLREDPQEVAALFRDLLIGVTNFFRDAEAFETLQSQVVPKLFEGRGADQVVRIWVPGCATGEEVYSIAILLREQMDRLAAVPRVQIFATDIDERALAVARAARYPTPLLDSVPPERRARFFVADGGSHVVAKEVRDLCTFSPHSVIRDPPFSRIDLVSCRNLLIYFGPDVQNQVLPVFHYALRPDGYLFLGTAENIGRHGDLFAPLDKKHRIFRRRSEGTARVRLPMRLAGLRPGQGAAPVSHRAQLGGISLRQAVEGQVLERFSPPFVVVNGEGDVAYYSARTGRYLEPAPGAPTRQLLTMARKGLRLDLRTALREAAETGAAATREGVVVEGEDGRVQMITLTVEPLRDSDRDDPLFLVLFAEEGPALDRAQALERTRPADGAAQQLERELRETRERLQSLVEEYETALEELKSSNEELVSVNEELQSTNEELEASKEELQSVNEELHTVNAELAGKVEALDHANADLQNLFESADLATVFLDSNLVIRSFTPAVARVFNILPGDRGRPVTDLASRFSLPDLPADVACVMATGDTLERRVDSVQDGAHYLVRLSPYRDGDQRTRGAVVTFVDVTGITQAEDQQTVLIRELHHRTRNLLTVVRAIATLTLGKGGSLHSFNERLAALGRVQDLVSRSNDDGMDLAVLVQQELDAHGAPDGSKVEISGPPVSLGSDRVQVLALALHELATNAMKYGALKQEAGKLSVHWHVEDDAGQDPCVVLDWTESGVAMPKDAPGRGYGRHLIERALAMSLGTTSELAFGADGVRCRISIPLGARPRREPA